MTCDCCGAPLPAHLKQFCNATCRAEFSWPADKIAMLTYEWMKGTPTLQIAKKLGATNSATCAKARRLNLPMRGSPLGPVKLPEIVSGISMAELKPHECLYPLGGPKDPPKFFCGERTDGGPYCTKHRRVAYIKNSARRAA